MAALIDTALADQVPAYNGIQFGGSDENGQYKIMPPNYTLAGEFVYDRAGRAVTHTRYILNLAAEVYAVEGFNANTNMDTIRRKLSEPGKTLKLSGLGCGFTVRNPTDLIFGPLPRSINLRPLGGDAWYLDYALEFNVSECANLSYAKVGAMAFNFEVAWQNSLEGIGSRTISGYLQVAGQRNNAGNAPVLIADQYRRQITIVVPNNYRRVQNSWRTNAAKNQIDFTVTDQQIEADPPPPGITAVAAPFNMASEGPGFSKAVATFSMSMRTAPGVPRARAAQVFIQSAIARQQAIQRDYGAKVTVIPSNIQVGHDTVSRDSSFSMSWAISGCISNFLGASMIWEPLPESNYQKWRQSMEALGVWGNRGVNGLAQNPAEDLIIDTCDKAAAFVVGNDESAKPTIDGVADAPFSCGKITPETSWLGYDVEVLVKRVDNQTVARRATSYTPSLATPAGTFFSVSNTSYAPLPVPAFEILGALSHVIEYNGMPTNRVLLRFMGLRIQHAPTIPNVVSVAGIPATFKKLYGGVPQVVMNLLGCPVYFTRAAIEYEVNGYIGGTKPLENPLICAGDANTATNGAI